MALHLRAATLRSSRREWKSCPRCRRPSFPFCRLDCHQHNPDLLCRCTFFAFAAPKFPKWNSHPHAAFQKTRPCLIRKRPSPIYAVKHLLLCHIERRPPRLDLKNYPHLPLAEVQTTQAADYMALLSASPFSLPSECSR
jgi:hypothetical protein